MVGARGHGPLDPLNPASSRKVLVLENPRGPIYKSLSLNLKPLATLAL